MWSTAVPGLRPMLVTDEREKTAHHWEEAGADRVCGPPDPRGPKAVFEEGSLGVPTRVRGRRNASLRARGCRPRPAVLSDSGTANHEGAFTERPVALFAALSLREKGSPCPSWL